MSDKEFVYYPDLHDPDFYKKIYSKKEFHKHRIPEEKRDIEEICDSTKFKLMPHQEFLRNYVSLNTPYNGVLIFHGTGVGKTCTAISIAEQFKKQLRKYNKKILVILSSSIQENFIRQIYDIEKEKLKQHPDDVVQCTGDTYKLPSTEKHLTPEQKKKLVETMIKNNYEFFGYTQFANMVKRETNWDGSDSTITKIIKANISHLFSNTVIVIDEAHNIKSEDRIERTEEKVASSKEMQNRGQIIETVIRYAKNVRLVLLTATPMYNSPSEIVYLLNLLLLNDRRKQLKERDLFVKDGLFERLRPGAEKMLFDAAKGYVSYLKGNNPITFPFRIYPVKSKIPKVDFDIYGRKIVGDKQFYETRVIECIMEDEQLKAYRDIFGTRKTIDYNNSDSDSGINSNNNPVINQVIENNSNTKTNNQNTTKTNNVNTNNANANNTKANNKKSNINGLNSNMNVSMNNEAINTGNEEIKSNNVEDSQPSPEKDKTALEMKQVRHQALLAASNIVYEDKSGNYVLGDKAYRRTDDGLGAFYEHYHYDIRTKKKLTKSFKFQKHSIFHRGAKDEAPFIDMKYLHKYSQKMSEILDNVINSNGLVYVYSQYIASGVLPLALALEQNGFIRYTGKSGENHLLDYDNKRVPISYSPDKNVKFRPAKYILLTADTDLSRIGAQEAAEIFRGDKNKNGEIVKVILATRVGGEGLDFKNIRQIHITEPWYNFSRLEQIIGRGVRNCSHKSKPADERNVEIFKYTSVLPQQRDKKKIESIDQRYYRISEIKDRNIKKVEKILKESAVDCSLNINGNFIKGDKIVTLTSSLGEKIKLKLDNKTFNDYQCKWKPKPGEQIKINEDTFQLSAKDSDVLKAKRLIKKLFVNHYILDLNTIVRLVHNEKEGKGLEKIYIYKALDLLVDNENEVVTDRYNRPGYIIYRGNYYVYQPMELNDPRIPLYYRKTPLTSKPKKIPLTDILDEFMGESEEKKIDIKQLLPHLIERIKDTIIKMGFSSEVVDKHNKKGNDRDSDDNRNSDNNNSALNSSKNKKIENNLLGLNSNSTSLKIKNKKKHINVSMKNALIITSMIMDRVVSKTEVVHILKILLDKFYKGKLKNEYERLILYHYRDNLLRKNKYGIDTIGLKIDKKFYCHDVQTDRTILCNDKISKEIEKDEDNLLNPKFKDNIFGFRFSHEYYCFKDKKWDKCPNEIVKMVELAERIIRNQKRKIIKNNAAIMGVISLDDNNRVVFKILDKSKYRETLTLEEKTSKRSEITGRVCQTLDKGDLTEILKQLKGSMHSNFKKTKQNLCQRIEYQLRKYDLENKDDKIWFISDLDN